MFTKAQFLDSIRNEVNLCKHIHTKLSAENADYRPGEGTRSTLELMRYLTWCGIAPMEGFLRDDWSVVGQYQEKQSEVTFENFGERMDQQMQQIESALAKVSDEDLSNRRVKFPFGDMEFALGESLVNMPLKFMAAYRLQLFNHAKVNGHPELGTFNAWLGCDAPAGM